MAPWWPYAFFWRTASRKDGVQPCASDTLHQWEEERAAGDDEDPVEPQSKVGVRALRTARAFCREMELLAWVRRPRVHKGLAPNNAALWRERVTRAEPREAEAFGAPEYGRTLRSRNQWTARWSRRWNARRGFFKAGERLPLETRRAKARFFCRVPTNGKKRGPENGPQSRPPSEQHTRGVFKKGTPLFFETPVRFSRAAF